MLYADKLNGLHLFSSRSITTAKPSVAPIATSSPGARGYDFPRASCNIYIPNPFGPNHSGTLQ
ncbi:hypothetical protein E6H31_01550 [Candidatus Bathyarchaeota archaeon]|nr:MAG: hypothetical protein E6H31_01550 [Candidatus Bathyarchaeota archaeon]